DPLVAALVGNEVPVPPARVGCDGDDDVPCVWALPEVATQELANVDDTQLGAITEKVFAADAIGSGDTADDDTRTYFLDHALRPLRELAREATRRGARLFHYFALHY